MGRLLGLPTASSSQVTAVACCRVARVHARCRVVAVMGHEAIGKLVAYASDQTHATFQNGARLVGLPPANFRVITTSPESEHSLSAATVAHDVARGLVPLYLCMTGGMTGVGAVDHVRKLGEVDARGRGLRWQRGRLPQVQGYLDGAELALGGEIAAASGWRGHATRCHHRPRVPQESCQWPRTKITPPRAASASFKLLDSHQGRRSFPMYSCCHRRPLPCHCHYSRVYQNLHHGL
jgi:hypothetical protein